MGVGLGLMAALAVLPVILMGSLCPPPPAVRAPCGSLTGTYAHTRDGNTVAAFLGIPFAKPPVGRLRFEPPVPIKESLNDYSATKQPEMCIQINDGRVVGSEDCLYLNVYTPYTSLDMIRTSPSLPVLVYFHGSIDRHGASKYTQEYLLDENIVYVVVQYRRGLFGWLSTGDQEVPGNMALKDLLLALRWLQRNILSFGGDPRQVTIFGHSVGAVAVHALMLFASDEGLFRAGISHSGSLTSINNFHTPTKVRQSVRVLASLSGCPEHPAGLVHCLRAMTAEEIVILYSMAYTSVVSPPLHQLFRPLVGFIGPVLEPAGGVDSLIRSHPWRTSTRVPWLVGVASKETNLYFINALRDDTDLQFKFLDYMFDYLYPLLLDYRFSCAGGRQVARAARRFYLSNHPISRATLKQAVDMFSDAYILYGVYKGIRRANASSTFVFMFDYLTANQQYVVPEDARYGASHGDELWLFFPHPSFPSDYPRVYNESDERLSRRLVKLWTNFATNLNPTPCQTRDSQGLIWDPFSKDQAYLHIRQEGLKMEHRFFSDQARFWDSQPYPIRDDYF